MKHRTGRRRPRVAVWVLLAVLAACSSEPGNGRVLVVGPGHSLKVPSEAAAQAKPGDTIRIEAGEYADCAVWRASNITIEGLGTGAVLAGKSCAGKGIFVVDGSDVTIRNLTFRQAQVPDHNGAGIRAEARNLTVEHSRFIDNENGILAAAVSGSTMRIVDSEFRGNGKCAPLCAHGIYVNAIDLLDIENSRFFDQHVGHHVKSRALRTVLIGNDIADGPDGNASYLVDVPNGGDLLMEGNTLEKGPKSENDTTAVAIGMEGAIHPTHALTIRNNGFTNDMTKPTFFVRNHSTTPARLSGNRLHGPVTALEGPGSVSP